MAGEVQSWAASVAERGWTSCISYSPAGLHVLLVSA